MRSIKRIVLAAVVATMAFSMAGCNLIQKTPEAIQNTVLAKVGSEKITLGDVDAELKADIDYLKETYGDDFESKIDDELKAKLKEVRQQVLDALVEEKILYLEAEKKGLVPTQEELDKEVAERTAEIQEAWGGEEAFIQAKEYYGYTDETFKAFLEDQVVIQKVKDEMFKDINITDDQINKYYEEHKDEFVNYGQANSRHLLFQTEEEAKAASDKIKSGETTFDALFKEYEGNKAKKTAEGATEEDAALPISEDLGTVSHNQQNFDPLFLEGLKPLKEGEVSEPVKSSFGYHIIEATNVTETTPKEFNDELKAQIKTTLENEEKNSIYKTQLDSLEKEYKVKTYENRL
ncbi:Foldase protein prsA precursor [uncultured Clostridium sp.]|uniref:peptidylprolyl isomerase n=1 Tax=uncultured Clostridium sp. TaxID=59620 RepID=UPI000822A5B4|nr:peptidylprolyl isomerase [uncultured Clostridium sp.]SCJ95151.1 Foldase protein prsA precursor [uncultured Clostridium sp.]